MDIRQQKTSLSRPLLTIGGSAGGLKAFSAILADLPADFLLPVMIVQHLHTEDGGGFSRYMASCCRLPVIEPYDKEQIIGGVIYVAPAGYHMLVERNGTVSLSTEEKVNWSRPSIDVLFESAAAAMENQVVAVILTGASCDGAHGIQAVKAAGGVTIAQDPSTAEYPLMPQAAIDTGAVVEILDLPAIADRLRKMRPSETETNGAVE